jgi:kexin
LVGLFLPVFSATEIKNKNTGTNHFSRGESGIGRWTVIIRDTELNNEKGKFIDWHLKLWGESIDASQAKLLPMPSNDDDADHDLIQSTVSGVASTKSITAPTSTKTLSVTANPTDHPVRPTKPGAKPTESTESTEPTKPQETSADEKPSDTEHEVASGTESAQPSSTTSAASSWVSWLPTFGTKAKIWIYGASGLIVAFCCGLGIYLYIARRRRLRNNPNNNYEFELLDEEEAEGLTSAEKGPNSGKKTRRTRGGELYDAFAGGSDDDDEFDAYRDRSAGQMAGHDPDEPEHYVVGEESDDDGDEAEKQRLRR